MRRSPHCSHRASACCGPSASLCPFAVVLVAADDRLCMRSVAVGVVAVAQEVVYAAVLTFLSDLPTIFCSCEGLFTGGHTRP